MGGVGGEERGGREEGGEERVVERGAVDVLGVEGVEVRAVVSELVGNHGLRAVKASLLNVRRRPFTNWPLSEAVSPMSSKISWRLTFPSPSVSNAFAKPGSRFRNKFHPLTHSANHLRRQCRATFRGQLLLLLRILRFMVIIAA